MSTTLLYDTALAAAGAIAGEMLVFTVILEGAMNSNNPTGIATMAAPLMLIAPIGGAVASLHFLGGKPVNSDMFLPIALAWGVSYLFSSARKNK